MLTIERAYELRAMIEKASANLTDEDALTTIELFPEWAVGVDYAADTRFRRLGTLYRVVQAHTSQEDWLPEETPALYTPVAEPGTIPVWRQPTGAQDAYNIGDKVHFPAESDPVYTSLIDGNVWSPEAYPQGWAIDEQEEPVQQTEPEEPEEPDTPVEPTEPEEPVVEPEEPEEPTAPETPTDPAEPADGGGDIPAEGGDDGEPEGDQTIPVWESGLYLEAGTLVSYNGLTYTVLQTHTTQDGWTPDAVPALYALNV